MSKFLILPLLVLMSCKIEQTKNEGNTGKFQDWSPQTNLEDNERVKIICQALARKADVLNVLSTSGANQYTFSYAEKGCSQTSMPEAKDIKVNLVRSVSESESDSQSRSQYGFKTIIHSESFGFPDVETAAHGVMAKICNFGATLESPIETSPTGGTWWTTFSAAEHCDPGFGRMCIYLQQGTQDPKTGRYRIHTEEWIKFKVMDEREGFFLERKLISSAGCGKGQTTERKAVLR